MVLPYILLVLFVIALAVYCSRSRRKPFSYELISKMSCSALFVLTALALRAEMCIRDSPKGSPRLEKAPAALF